MAHHGAHKPDLNTATRDQLMQVEGIGAEVAGRIVEYREDNGPFASFGELDDVYDLDEESKDLLRRHTTLGRRAAMGGAGRGHNGESPRGNGNGQAQPRPDRARPSSVAPHSRSRRGERGAQRSEDTHGHTRPRLPGSGKGSGGQGRGHQDDG